MKIYSDSFRQPLVNSIISQINAFFKTDYKSSEFLLDLALPPQRDMGHFAFPCFKFSKALKKSPKDIALLIEQNWRPTPEIKEVKASGPYLNFFVELNFFGHKLLEPILTRGLFQQAQADGNHKPYLIEFSQPNTHKELHVGHMRNLCYGQSLIELFKHFGNSVVPCTFPGDVGTHVAKCLWYLKTKNDEPIPESSKGQWLGSLYTKGNLLLEDEKGSAKEDENRKELTEILKQIESGSGPYFELWQQTREWSLSLMNEVYDWAGVTFDRWFWESEVDSPSVKLVQQLHKDGKLVEDQGALGLHLDEEKLGFCMLLKSDGNGLYSTKDLELARRKFDEYDPEMNIVIVDMRQELHFRQVFTCFEKLGLGQKNRCMHLKYNFVELPDGAMSSRKGNIVPIMKLIENMEAVITSDYLERYRGHWSDQEIETTACQVAQGAIKYGMNRMDPNKKIVFDMKEWLRLDGESGPYIQYTVARLNSILVKLKATDDTVGSETDPQQPSGSSAQLTDPVSWDLLTAAQETELILQLSLFQPNLFRALQAYKTSGICGYLYDLAKAANSFYQACPIGKVENKDLQKARLALVSVTKAALIRGLELLAIPAPLKM